jgi:2-polyprenyl-3-methyl-5-hydroxy-6-metoxy-1,4-benzoquinol methylase
MRHIQMKSSEFDLAQQPSMLKQIEEEYLAFRRSQKDVLALMNQRYSADGMIRRSCPVCDADVPKTRFKKAGLEIVTCSSCNMEYSLQILRENLENDYYANDSSGFLPMLSHLRQHPVYQELDFRRATYILECLKCNGLKQGATLLDIGSGHGALMAAAYKCDVKAEGIEPSTILAEECRRRGLIVRSGRFPQALECHEKFSAIVLLDVFEHLAYPRACLSTIAEHLLPKGLLAIQVPNMASLLVSLEGEMNSNYGYGHWSYFTPDSLQDLLIRADFVPLHLETYISELHRIKCHSPERIAAALKVHRQHLPPGVEVTPDFLFEHRLGYKLFVIARQR